MGWPFRNSSALLISIFLLAVTFPQARAEDAMTGTVVGVIGIKNGGPMMGGAIYFFDTESGPPPSATRYWRVPTHVFPIDEQSRFTAVLPEGTYFVGAIERQSSTALGPPREGENFFISQDKKGMPRKLTVWKGSTIDLGMVVEALPFRRASLAKKGITAIQGTIRDERGRPREGIAVFAFASPSMLGRPLFVAERTAKDGIYLLRLAGAGTYYLRARSTYGGGPPLIGELMGVYGSGRPVTIKRGQTKKGADIRVFPVGM